MKFAQRVEKGTNFLLQRIFQMYNEGKLDREADFFDNQVYMIANQKGIFLKLYFEFIKHHDIDIFEEVENRIQKQYPQEMNKILDFFSRNIKSLKDELDLENDCLFDMKMTKAAAN